MNAITAGCIHSSPLTSGQSHSALLCSSAAVQLTSAALEIQHYHIIYEGWPSGKKLKQEYQLSFPAVLLSGLPPGLGTYTSPPRIVCYLQAEVQWVLFICHLSGRCVYTFPQVFCQCPTFATQGGTKP